jgi:hypothetical protein
LRTSTAPVLTYVRGYDGRTRLTETSSFSNPNLPALSRVRYPTVGNYDYGPRVIPNLPWGNNAINWIDQNLNLIRGAGGTDPRARVERCRAVRLR